MVCLPLWITDDPRRREHEYTRPEVHAEPGDGRSHGSFSLDLSVVGGCARPRPRERGPGPRNPASPRARGRGSAWRSCRCRHSPGRQPSGPPPSAISCFVTVCRAPRAASCMIRSVSVSAHSRSCSESSAVCGKAMRMAPTAAERMAVRALPFRQPGEEGLTEFALDRLDVGAQLRPPAPTSSRTPGATARRVPGSSACERGWRRGFRPGSPSRCRPSAWNSGAKRPRPATRSRSRRAVGRVR